MHRRFLLCILVSLAAGPSARPDPAAGAPRLEIAYWQFTLPNGLTVILHEDPWIPLVSVNVCYHVGSARERPGRTGLAHLFEHIMFEGSAHVPEGMFDEWLEAAGGVNNGGTDSDRTVYWVDAPAGALELALFLESDRMGHLLEALSPEKVDGQREVVKNERLQSYENRPYGLAFLTLSENLYPPEHPYHWPTIGRMLDLDAASYEDVTEFFRRYYGPGNASLVIAGDIDPAQTRRSVEKWFGEIAPGPAVPPPDPPPALLAQEKRLVLEDRVQLPRLYVAWLTPAHFAPGDAELDLLAHILAGSKDARLYRRLVYELEIAQDVTVFQESAQLGSVFYIICTARGGRGLAELGSIIDEELARVAAAPPSARELERALNQYEVQFLDRLEQVGGFEGKASQLSLYLAATGNPDYVAEDLARYRALSESDIAAAARAHLRPDARVILSVVPEGRSELAWAAPPGAGPEAGSSAEGTAQ